MMDVIAFRRLKMSCGNRAVGRKQWKRGAPVSFASGCPSRALSETWGLGELHGERLTLDGRTIAENAKYIFIGEATVWMDGAKEVRYHAAN